MSKDDIVIPEITGTVRLGDDASGLYRESALKEYIIREHAKRYKEEAV